jgi:hypothetical protein
MANIQDLLQVSAMTSKNRVQAQSREGYDGKIRYIIKFMEDKYPAQVDRTGDGIKTLILPLSFESIKALFAKIMIDTDLPRDAKKRKQLEQARLDEILRKRAAAIARGDDEADIPELPVIIEDTTVNKANSITVSKSCLGGYKSALKCYYSDREVAFECPDRGAGSQSIDNFLDEQIKCYANLIAEKKQRAVMPISEGKAAMTEEGFMELINKLIAFKPNRVSSSICISSEV